MEHSNEPQKPQVRRRYHPPENTDVPSQKAPSIEEQKDIPFQLPQKTQQFEQPDSHSTCPSYSLQYPSQYSSQMAGDFHNATQHTSCASTKRKIPYYLGIALCSLVLVVSAGMLIRYYSQIYRANNATSQFRELYSSSSTATTAPPPSHSPVPSPVDVTSSPTVQAAATPVPAASSTPSPSATTDFLAQWPSHYPGNEQLRIQEKFTPLRRQNRDVVGWLTIEGVVDEPVFQRDNSYYLTHDATGAKNPTGALFLDENCNLRTVPMQVLIHGHNMKEGAMFGSLKKYKVKDASFYREHPFIQFDSLYESATYVIFAVAEVNIVAGNTHYFPFWHKFRFDHYESFRQYVSLAKEYSRFKVDIDVQPGDRLLTLATCSSGDDNLRLIIMARMLRDNENTIMLTNQIYSATAK